MKFQFALVLLLGCLCFWSLAVELRSPTVVAASTLRDGFPGRRQGGGTYAAPVLVE